MSNVLCVQTHKAKPQPSISLHSFTSLPPFLSGRSLPGLISVAVLTIIEKVGGYISPKELEDTPQPQPLEYPTPTEDLG